MDLNDKETSELLIRLLKKDLKNGGKTISGITDKCFCKCVHDFTVSSLGKKEKSCVENCASKQVDLMDRAQRMYQEVKTQGMQPPSE